MATLEQIDQRTRVLREVVDMIDYYLLHQDQPLPREFYQLVERGY